MEAKRTGKFIVVFKDTATKEQIHKCAQDVDQNGGKVRDHFDLLNGFSATIPTSFLNQLWGFEGVDYIEPDGVATTNW